MWCRTDARYRDRVGGPARRDAGRRTPAARLPEAILASPNGASLRMAEVLAALHEVWP